MLRAPGHPGLCFFHAEQNEQFINADEVAAELTTGVGDFGTPVDVNRALGKLFKLVASRRLLLKGQSATSAWRDQPKNAQEPPPFSACRPTPIRPAANSRR